MVKEIDEFTRADVRALFDYWRDFPPAHEILKLAFRVERKPDMPKAAPGADPSGIGALIARFPDGKVRVG